MTTALQRGLRTLDLLARRGEAGMGFNELVAKFPGMGRASLSRLLRSLIASGFAVKDANTGRYLCGPSLGVFAAQPAAGRRAWLLARCRPAMAEITRRFDLTCLLLERVGDVLVCIDKTQSESSAHMQEIGFINDDFSQPWMHLLAAYDPRLAPRIGDDAALAALRATGHIYDDQTLRTNFRRLGFPVIEPGGELAGVLGLGGSILQISNELRDRIIATVRRLLAEPLPRRPARR